LEQELLLLDAGGWRLEEEYYSMIYGVVHG